VWEKFIHFVGIRIVVEKSEGKGSHPDTNRPGQAAEALRKDECAEMGVGRFEGLDNFG
jgi:hypothetical protein